MAQGVTPGDPMATIVDIRSAASARGARSQSPPVRGSAEILLFTGIRYERKPRTAAERARDRLDLED